MKGRRVKSHGGAERVGGGAEFLPEAELQRWEEQQSIWISWIRYRYRQIYNIIYWIRYRYRYRYNIIYWIRQGEVISTALGAVIQVAQCSEMQIEYIQMIRQIGFSVLNCPRWFGIHKSTGKSTDVPRCSKIFLDFLDVPR